MTEPDAGTSSPAATPLRRERRSCQTSSDANGIEGANRRHDASSTRSNVTLAATAPGDFGSMSLPQARCLASSMYQSQYDFQKKL
jgi:hypothetical protein